LKIQAQKTKSLYAVTGKSLHLEYIHRKQMVEVQFHTNMFCIFMNKYLIVIV